MTLYSHYGAGAVGELACLNTDVIHRRPWRHLARNRIAYGLPKTASALFGIDIEDGNAARLGAGTAETVLWEIKKFKQALRKARLAYGKD